LRCPSLHRRAAGSAFLVALPLPSLSRRRCLPCRAAAAFVVAPPLSSSGMAERQKEWQNGRMAEMATYVLFMVHANDNDNDTLIF
jgi:hypothetical protein